MVDYRERNLPTRIETIGRCGTLSVFFRSDQELLQVRLHTVAYVKTLRYHLFSLTALIKNVTGVRDAPGVEAVVIFPAEGKPVPTDSSIDHACVMIAPGRNLANPTAVDINVFHCAHGHTHGTTAKKQGITLTRKLHECTGCWLVKGLRETHSRAAKKMGQAFVDLSVNLNRWSVSVKNKRPMIVHDD